MSKVRLAIFGGQGSGMQIACVARRIDPSIDILGYLNDREPVGCRLGGLPVLGPFEDWTRLDPEVRLAAGLHSSNRMAERIARIETLGVPTARWQTTVDPSAVLFDGVVLGSNVFVSPLASIKSDVKIADHVSVRDGAMIGHDAALEEHVFIGANAAVGGYSIVHRGAYVGMGAVIRERLRIGAMSVVGMGAVVVDDVPDGVVVAGNPARILSRDGGA